MNRIVAYLRGMWQFRRSFTTSYDYPLIEAYDRGREHAHKITNRKWDAT